MSRVRLTDIGKERLFSLMGDTEIRGLEVNETLGMTGEVSTDVAAPMTEDKPKPANAPSMQFKM